MKKSHRIFRLMIMLPCLFITISIALVLLFKWVPVVYTPLMLKRTIEFRKDDTFHTTKKWVKLEEISPHMVNAVILTEDQKFYTHKGFDWEEIRKMWDQHSKGRGKLRGCSTISQQTAKNMFSSGSATWVRKIWEAYWTFLIEKMWSKDRIMEVYLNIIEMGPGIYGVEAAAQKYYNRSASKLTREQAISIAICLPNPLRMNPTKPTRYQLDRRATLLRQIK